MSFEHAHAPAPPGPALEQPLTPLGSVGRWRDLLRDWKGAEVGAVQYLRRELAALNEGARRIQLRIHGEQRTSQQEHFEQQATQRANQQASKGEGENEVPAAGLPGVAVRGRATRAQTRGRKWGAQAFGPRRRRRRRCAGRSGAHARRDV